MTVKEKSELQKMSKLHQMGRRDGMAIWGIK